MAGGLVFVDEARNQFAGHAYDSQIVLEKVLPMALKTARPGTREFRAAIRDAMETNYARLDDLLAEDIPQPEKTP